MYEQKIKYGIYPKDQPKNGTEEVYYWDSQYWCKCFAKNLEEGDRWAYEIPKLEERKRRIKDLGIDDLLAKLEEAGVDINAVAY